MHTTCICGMMLSTEHLVFECRYSKQLWNEIANIKIGNIDPTIYVNSLNTMISFMEHKYKEKHNVTSNDSSDICQYHISNMKKVCILEIIASCIQAILTVHFKRIELKTAVHTINDTHRVDQMTS